MILRNPHRYREQAARFRELASAASDSTELRDSYLALSLQYERLAVVLEKSAPADEPVVLPKRQFWRGFRRK
jgi:hypothetical protein